MHTRPFTWTPNVESTCSCNYWKLCNFATCCKQLMFRLSVSLSSWTGEAGSHLTSIWIDSRVPYAREVARFSKCKQYSLWYSIHLDRLEKFLLSPTVLAHHWARGVRHAGEAGHLDPQNASLLSWIVHIPDDIIRVVPWWQIWASLQQNTLCINWRWLQRSKRAQMFCLLLHLRQAFWVSIFVLCPRGTRLMVGNVLMILEGSLVCVLAVMKWNVKWKSQVT